jgi:hypothetical protein
VQADDVGTDSADAVRMLLGAGADPSRVDPSGRSAETLTTSPLKLYWLQRARWGTRRAPARYG